MKKPAPVDDPIFDKLDDAYRMSDGDRQPTPRGDGLCTPELAKAMLEWRQIALLKGHTTVDVGWASWVRFVSTRPGMSPERASDFRRYRWGLQQVFEGLWLTADMARRQPRPVKNGGWLTDDARRKARVDCP